MEESGRERSHRKKVKVRKRKKKKGERVIQRLDRLGAEKESNRRKGIWIEEDLTWEKKKLRWELRVIARKEMEKREKYG